MKTFLPIPWFLTPVFAWFLAGTGVAQPTGVVINEILADNSTGLRDQDGTASDWLELHNPTAQAVPLAGAFLTDSPGNPAKWPLPAVVLPPGGYLLIFASGKDRRDPAGELHANFALSKEGEYLALTWQGTVTASFVPSFPAQFADVSYGFAGNGGGPLAYMAQPTPGAPNLPAAAVPGPVAISPPGGTFTGSFSATLTSETAGAVIHYTLDGTLPTAASPVYQGPVPIVASTRLRAMARIGSHASPVAGTAWIRLAPDMTGYTSPLPLMVIDNFNGGPVPAKGLGIQQVARQAAEWMLHEAEGGASNLSATPQLSGGIGIRGRGHFSSTWSRKAYAVETWAADGSAATASPLNLPANDDWVLYYPDPGEFRDPTMIANTFIYELSRRLGRYAPRFRFVELFLNQDGGDLRLADRQGVYVLMEKISRGPQRLDFSSLSADGASGGALLAIDRPDAVPETGFPAANGAVTPWFFRTAGPDRILQTTPNSLTLAGDDLPGNSSAAINFVQPGGYRILPAQRAALEGWFRQFEDALYHPLDWRDPATGWRRWLVEEDWAQGYLLQNFTRHFDALRLSVYPWLGDDRKLRLGPIWDTTPDSYSGEDPPDHSLYYRSGTLWFPRLFADADFKQTYLDQWTRWRRTGFSDAAMEAIIDRQAAAITPVKAVAQGIPHAADWQARLTTMKTWVKGRAAYFDSSFVPLPVIGPAGGIVSAGSAVSVTAPAGEVWVTTDGSDPRRSGGTVSPTAVPGTGLTIPADTRITARVRQGTEWSGPVTAAFSTGSVAAEAGNPVISEIHYHPAALTAEERAAGWTSREEFEFIELQNRAGAKVSLHDVRLVLDRNLFEPAWEGAASGSWTIPAGGRIVLVRNPAAFASRYPQAAPPAGVFTGELSNASGRLILEKVDGTPLGMVSYGTVGAWPAAADGPGYSLTLREDGRPGFPEDWRSSVAPHGSPGGSDAAAYSGTSETDWKTYALGLTELPVWPGSATGLEPGRQLRFRIPPGADRARYTVEESADLQQWRPAAVTGPAETRPASGAFELSWEIPGAATGPFLRIRARAFP